LDQVAGIPKFSAFTSFIAFGSIGVCCGVAIVALVGSLAQRSLSWRWVYGFGVAAVALIVSGLMRAHHGGFVNVLIQLHWVIAFGFGAAVSVIRRDNPGLMVMVLTALVVTAQLFWQLCWMDPGARTQFSKAVSAEDGGLVTAVMNFRPSYSYLIPSEADREAGDLFVETLKTYEGPILSPYAPWLAYQAGFDPSLHLIALWDIAQHKKGPYFSDGKSIGSAAKVHYWGAVVDGTKPMRYGVSGEKGFYKLDKVVLPPGRGFMPKTGWRARPHSIWVPKEK
jgi:hypothetical protein